jgi:hypothetical protein
VDLTEADVSTLVNLRNINISGEFKANLLRTEGDLYLNSEGGNGAIFGKGISLRSASVGGTLALYGATVMGKLDADSVKVKESLLMGKDGMLAASFQEIVLRHATVGGLLDMRGSTHQGQVLVDRI